MISHQPYKYFLKGFDYRRCYFFYDNSKYSNETYYIKKVSCSFFLERICMKQILVLAPFLEKHHELLKESAAGQTLLFRTADTVLEEELLASHIIIGNPPIPFLKNAENLELVCLHFAGATPYCAPGALPTGVVLTNASGAFGEIISEWLLDMTFHIYQHLSHYEQNQKEHLWQAGPLPYTLRDKTVLVVGAGDIGTSFAAKAKLLGAKTIGLRRQDTTPSPAFDAVHRIEVLDDLLPAADIIALSLPETNATKKIINKERLSAMKKTAVLLNVGRGSAIETNALLATLPEGKLLGVGLDVTDPEPLPPNHLLWDAPRVHITPHISGLSAHEDVIDYIAALSAYNIQAHLSGKPLKNIVNREIGY
jgi:phosphoglycerate dehydrogenase-like enzyme